MNELDFNHEWLEAGNRGGDEKLAVRFFSDAVPDEEKSQAQGRRCFRDAAMISIVTPGDKRNIIVREVREEDKQRFPKHWEHFEKTHEALVDGFPLGEWAALSKAMIEELKYMGFQTVDQLANAGDHQLRYPGMQEVKARAKRFLEAQNNAAPVEKMGAELKQRDEQIAALQAQVAELVKAQSKAK